MRQQCLVFYLDLTNSFPSVDFGLGLKQDSLARMKVLTHCLNRYMALIILEERLLKLYVNTFELDIYRRKRVLREKGRRKGRKELARTHWLNFSLEEGKGKYQPYQRKIPVMSNGTVCQNLKKWVIIGSLNLLHKMLATKYNIWNVPRLVHTAEGTNKSSKLWPSPRDLMSLA